MSNNKYLNGWKEIANYLDRGVRTVQRWEQHLELPVRRPNGSNRSAVVGLRNELDEWMARAPRGRDENAGHWQQTISQLSTKVLVVEDSVHDLNTCVSVLRTIGVSQLDAISNVPAALLRLEEIAAGKLLKPDIIILDLAFPSQSGFEILRYLKSTWALKTIPVVVWTAMDYTEQQLSSMFGVRKVVRKWAGASELEEAVRAAVAA